MNQQELEKATRELTDLATRMYSDDPETIALVFERSAVTGPRRLLECLWSIHERHETP